MFEPVKLRSNVFLGYTESYRVRFWRDMSSISQMLGTILVVSLCVGIFTNWRLAMGSFSYFLLAFGYSRRKTLHIHVPLMVSGITLDLFLVAFLAITRDAVGSALHEPLNALQMAHVTCSSAAALLYFPLLIFGFMRLNFKSGEGMAKVHLILGKSAMALRTIGYFLMFSMPSL